MKRLESSIILTALLCGAACLAPSRNWARGGSGGHGSSHGGSVSVHGYYRSDGTHVNSHTRSAPGSGLGDSNDSGYSGNSAPVSGYTRKDGTYVAPYTRSAPGSGSGDSNDSVNNQVVPNPSPVPFNNSGERLGESPPQVVNTPTQSNLPQSTCGDKPTGGNNIWYPVFIDRGDLNKIRSQYCADAMSAVREDTKVESIQVASFNNRDRALQFAQLVGGEVGKATYPNKVEPPKDKTTADITTLAAPLSQTNPSAPSPLMTPSSPSLQTTEVSPSSSSLSGPSLQTQATDVSPSPQEDANQGNPAWIFLVLLPLGIWLAARKVLPRGNNSSYRANNNQQQALPDTTIEVELEALRRQVSNQESKMQSRQLEHPGIKKQFTVKKTIGGITTFVIVALMFKSCISGNSSNENACSQAQANLEHAKEFANEWGQEHPIITRDRLEEATKVAANQAYAERERERACR